MRQDFDMEVLLLAIPARLQTEEYTPVARALGWTWFEGLLRDYLDSLHGRRRIE